MWLCGWSYLMVMHSVQNFLYLLPYFQYIPNKSFIFVTRFPPISVMELVESGFIS